MKTAAATLCKGPIHDHRLFLADLRRLGRALQVARDGAIMGIGATGAVGLLAIGVTLAAAWMVQVVLSSNPQLKASGPSGPRTVALVQEDKVPLARPGTFDARWAYTVAALPPGAIPLLPERRIVFAGNVPLPHRRPPHAQVKLEVVTRAPDAPHPAALRMAERDVAVPAPRPHSAPSLVAAIPERPAAPKVIAPPPSAPVKPVAPQQVHNKASPAASFGSRTAVYDIAAATVYMPNGQRLEAHSGLGEKMDNPHYVNVRMRGPTPPNVYDLKLREALFHGVRAIRLTPVDEDKMFGRDGILAHTYMLGPNGQSNGCVSFRDYRKFLDAYLRGEVNRMVVVASLGNRAPRIASDEADDRWHTAANY